jgi:hypothetical protein
VKNKILELHAELGSTGSGEDDVASKRASVEASETLDSSISKFAQGVKPWT